MTKTDVEIYDTTLRDGSQGEGINFSVADKLRIAERIDAFGIHYIEGGWPGSNPKDIEFFGQARGKKFKHAKLAAFGATWQAAEKAGADFVVLCDTNGGRLPNEIARITSCARAKLNTRIGIHTHDDIGLGVANALAALEAGATHVQGTINGYGERTGNCNLISVIPNVALKLNKLCVLTKSLSKLKELSQ